MDEFAKQNKVQKLPRYSGVNDADIWNESCKPYLGRSHRHIRVFFFRGYGVKLAVRSQQTP